MSKPTQDKNGDIPIEVLKELLTPSEIRMLKNRWQIVRLLDEGLTIRNTAEQVGVGTDTVMRVAKMHPRSHPKKERKISSNTPWIFGKKK